VDGVKFVDETAAATHSASNGNDNNVVKILIIDVDSSDLRYCFAMLLNKVIFFLGHFSGKSTLILTRENELFNGIGDFCLPFIILLSLCY
jgi:hypothetical protein